jgi:hypothetical protein
VALAWAEVGRRLLFLLWEVELFPLNIGIHLKRIFSKYFWRMILRFWCRIALVVSSSESYHSVLDESI